MHKKFYRCTKGHKIHGSRIFWLAIGYTLDML
jgi:hypothetical protein